MAERFEVVVNLLDLRARRRLRIRVQVPESDPVLPSLFDLHPGTEAMERETFDMFGISFDGHPDLTRILMPEDWVGHPLRKDYEVGAHPRAVQGGEHMTTVDSRPGDARTSGYERFVPGTDEGDQQLKPRSELTAAELMREVGSVLRMSEAEAALLGDLPDDPDDDQTMIINMGPQHPSTHGVLRLMLELQGETVLRCKPIIGYLHTGMEKTGEQLTFMQGGTNVTRMDYLSPIANELVFSMATEQLLGIDEDIPERAVWIRMLLPEMSRMASHLLFMATNGMDLGAVSMMIYGWREREEVLRFFQEVTGLRMNHNYIRPGGVAADLPAGWRDGVLRILDLLPAATRRVRHPDDRPADLARAAAGRRRDHPERGGGPRRHRPDRCVRPASSGTCAATCRTLHYDEMEFDVIVGSYGDCVRPLRHPSRRDPRVDADRRPDPRSDAAGRLPHPGQEDHAAAAGAHRRVDGGA